MCENMRASCSSLICLMLSFGVFPFGFVKGFDCGSPGYRKTAPKPTFKSVFQNDHSPNIQVEYECEKSEYLLGDKYRFCQVNGTWSGSVPKCVPPASDIIKRMTVENSSIEKALSEGNLKCLTNGNEDDDDCVTYFKNSDGKRIWIDLAKTCSVLAVRITTQPKSVLNVTVWKEPMFTDCNVTALTGYSTETSNSYLCGLAYGDLIEINYIETSVKITEMKIYLGSAKVLCGLPDKPRYGWYNCNKSNGEFNYGCNQGILRGFKSTSCDEHGDWNNPAPVCRLNNEFCSIDDLSTVHGKWTLIYDNEAKLNCDMGYEPDGSDHVQCHNGHWEETYVECQLTKVMTNVTTMESSQDEGDSGWKWKTALYSKIEFTTTLSSLASEDTVMTDQNSSSVFTPKPTLSTKDIQKLSEERVMKIVLISSVSSAVTAICVLVFIIVVIMWRRRCKRRQNGRRSVGTTPATPRVSIANCEDHVYQAAIYEEMDKYGQNPYVTTPGRKRSMPKIPDILELVYSDGQTNRDNQNPGSFSDRLPGYGVHIYSEPLYSEVSQESNLSERSNDEIGTGSGTAGEEELQEEVFMENDFYGTESEV